MRQPTRRASRRARVQSSQDVGQFRVVAPGSVALRGGEQARALAESLSVFGNASARGSFAQQRIDRQEAAADFARGDVDEGRGGAYLRTVSTLEARAGWVEDTAEFDTAIRQANLSELDPDEAHGALDQLLDEMFQERYAGLDDEALAGELLPRMQRLRDEEHARLNEEFAQEAVDRNLTNLQVIARDDYENLGDGAEFDYRGLMDSARSLDKSTANDVFFGILTDIAIENGDPELLRGVPERWADGTPTPFGNPRYNEQARNAVLRADNKRAQLETARAKAAEAALEAERDQVYLAGAVGIIEGREPSRAIEMLAELGADGDQLLALRRAWATVRDDNQEQSADIRAMGVLMARAYTGDVTLTDAVTAFAEGTLGQGTAASQNLNRLLSVVESTRRSENSELSAQITGFQTSLGRAYKDNGIIPNPAVRGVEAKAREEYHVLTRVNEQDPFEAFQSIRAKYDPIYEAALGGSSQPEDAVEVLEAFRSGDAPASAVFEAGISVETIRTMASRGQLTADQLEAIADEYDR